MFEGNLFSHVDRLKLKKFDFTTICASIGIPLCALLIGYPQGIVSVGNTIGIFIVGICLLLKRRIGYNKLFMFLCLFYLLRLMFNYCIPQVYNNALYEYTRDFIRIIICICVTQGLAYYADEELTFKAWRIVALVPLVGLLYQCVVIYFLGNKVSPIILLPFGSINDLSLPGMHTWHVISSRPMSVFQEPSCYAVFMLPLLYMTLKWKKYCESFIITISLMLSTSTLGIISACLLWLIFVFFVRGTTQRTFLLLGVVALFIFLLSLPIFEVSRNKIFSPDYAARETILYRVVYGFKIYSVLPWHEQLAGIFYSSLADYMEDGKVVISDFSPSLFGYTNNVCKILIETGFVGFVIYIYFFIKILYKSEWCTRAYILLILVIAFAHKSYMMPSMFATYAPLLLYIRKSHGCRHVETLSIAKR